MEPPAVAIHSIQGPGDSSPVAGQLVATTGIVTGIKSNGFFIQTPDAEVDSYPDTSEGIFIFTSSAPPTGAAVGNLVKVVGTVQEFVPSADPPFPVTVIVNHLRSLSGIDDPVDGPRVRAKRAAQAEFLAGLIQQHQAAGEQGSYKQYACLRHRPQTLSVVAARAGIRDLVIGEP